jgi:hypothetical protein
MLRMLLACILLWPAVSALPILNSTASFNAPATASFTHSVDATVLDEAALLHYLDPNADHGIVSDPPGYRTGYLLLAMFCMNVIGGMIGECLLSLHSHFTKLTT